MVSTSTAVSWAVPSVMGWRSTDLSEDDAYQQAANLNLMFSQYGQRNEADRVEVQPPSRWKQPPGRPPGRSITG